MNLWWSWSREARRLFRSIDPALWHLTRHNPLELLCRVEPERLAPCASGSDFLRRYDEVLTRMRHEISSGDTWFRKAHPELDGRPVAYFCGEFGLHSSVPIYSGGLGVLAGDQCKGASDLGVPMVAVGLFYMKGYFDQRLRLDGWQLPAVESETLVEVPLHIEKPHGHHGDAEVARPLALVARQHAQAARVDRHRAVEPELATEVGDRTAVELGVRLPEPGVAARDLVAHPGQDLVVAAEEVAVAGTRG